MNEEKKWKKVDFWRVESNLFKLNQGESNDDIQVKPSQSINTAESFSGRIGEFIKK